MTQVGAPIFPGSTTPISRPSLTPAVGGTKADPVGRRPRLIQRVGVGGVACWPARRPRVRVHGFIWWTESTETPK